MSTTQISEATAWVLITICFCIVVYDTLTGFKVGADSTISRQLLYISQNYPLLPLVVGVILGHIFWPQKT